jgi:integrase
MTDQEERKFMEASSKHLKSILIVALNTGMRLGEILSLQWDQVDLGSRRIRVENTKSGKTRFVEVNTPLLRELLELRRRDSRSPYLFFNPKTGKPLSTVKTAFKASCRRAGVEGLRFHDLRHTFASRLVKRGIDLITVKALLGHSTVKITERYTHSDQERKRKAVELLSLSEKRHSEGLTHRRHTERKESLEEKL